MLVNMTNWTAVYVAVPEGYVAFVEELPGANTQGATLDEARENLREAVALVIEANREIAARSFCGHAVPREPLVVAVRPRADELGRLEAMRRIADGPRPEDSEYDEL